MNTCASQNPSIMPSLYDLFSFHDSKMFFERVSVGFVKVRIREEHFNHGDLSAKHLVHSVQETKEQVNVAACCHAHTGPQIYYALFTLIDLWFSPSTTFWAGARREQEINIVRPYAHSEPELGSVAFPSAILFSNP